MEKFVIQQASLHDAPLYLTVRKTWAWNAEAANQFDSRRAAARYLRDGVLDRSIPGYARALTVEPLPAPELLRKFTTLGELVGDRLLPTVGGR